jgi:hypothetical protein
VDRVADHDDFGSTGSKIINVIDSNSLELDIRGKALGVFRHRAQQSGDGDGKGSEIKKDGFG